MYMVFVCVLHSLEQDTGSKMEKTKCYTKLKPWIVSGSSLHHLYLYMMHVATLCSLCLNTAEMVN
jgi:hypothetical protein